MCRNTAAHRFPADEERPTGTRHALVNRFDDSDETAIEYRPSIGDAAILFGIWEVECDNIDSAGGERTREGHDKRTSLAGASAVGENQRCATC